MALSRHVTNLLHKRIDIKSIENTIVIGSLSKFSKNYSSLTNRNGYFESKKEIIFHDDRFQYWKSKGDSLSKLENMKWRNYSTIIKSPYPDLTYPTDLSLHDFILGACKKHEKRIAMVNGITGQEYTYGQMSTLAARLASSLHKLGFHKGSVATIFSASSPEYFIIYLGAMMCGGTVSGVNPTYTTDELSNAINVGQSTILFTSSELQNIATEAIKNCPTIKEVVVIDKEGGDGNRSLQNLFEGDLATLPTNVDINALEDVAALPFSSGTTGLPKAVMLTHTNIVVNILQSKAPTALDYSPDDVLLCVLPLYHIYGLIPVGFTAFYSGAKLVILPKFEPQTYLEALAKYKANNLHVVPPLMLFLAKHPLVSKYDLSSVNHIMVGAAPCGEETLKEVKPRFRPDICIRQGYGMTEAAPLTHINPTDKVKFHTVGQNVQNTTSMVLDIDTREPLEQGKTGEILIKGPQIMKGYYNNPTATAETVVDGWLLTGDVGYFDEDGYLIISDRIKELIKVKGFQVAPAELEALLVTHPAVVDAAVVPRPDERLGEAPVAFVVIKDSFKPTDELAKEIDSFVADRVAPFKRLVGGIQFRKEIPKAASGKLLRRVLKAELLDQK